MIKRGAIEAATAAPKANTHLLICESPAASLSRMSLVLQYERNTAAPPARSAAVAARAPSAAAATACASTAPPTVELVFSSTRTLGAMIVASVYGGVRPRVGV